MLTLEEIIQADADYMKDVSVHVASIYGHVTITDCTGVQDDIFLDGTDGSAFISERNRIYNESGTLTHDEIELHLAKPYVENNWN